MAVDNDVECALRDDGAEGSESVTGSNSEQLETISSATASSESSRTTQQSQERNDSQFERRRRLSIFSTGSAGEVLKQPSTQRLTSAFIQSVRSDLSLTGLSLRERCRVRTELCLSSLTMDMFLGVVVICDLVVMSEDINFRAANTAPPKWMEAGSGGCLLLYSFEFLLSFFARGVDMFKERVVILDAFILLVGYADLALSAFGVSAQEVGMLRILRMIRMMRLLRVARKSPALKELRKLMTMFASCIKTLFWSLVFCFLVLSLWAMAAVELIQPLIPEMVAEGLWRECGDRCTEAFSTVMRANLTLFKNIVAGDSWGLMAEPISVRHPRTAIIFVGSLVSLVLGVLNLVVAVVVDTAAEQRQKDVMRLAEDMDNDQESDLKFLTNIFRKIDEDGSGEIELDELIKGAQEVPEFQSRLRVMDIDKDDLIQLFQMLDSDNDGSITPAEFQYALSRWLHDSKTATRFVKYNVMKLGDEQKQLAEQVQRMGKKNEQQFDTMMKMVKAAIRSRSSPHDPIRRPKRLDTTAAVASTSSSLSSYSKGSKASKLQNVSRSVHSYDATHGVSVEDFAGMRVAADPRQTQDNRDSAKLLDLDLLNSDVAKLKSDFSEAARVAERNMLASLQEALKLYEEAALVATDASLRAAAAKMSRQVDAVSVEAANVVGLTAPSEVHASLEQALGHVAPYEFGPSAMPSQQPLMAEEAESVFAGESRFYTSV
eukprot:TRINITY_DN19407_c0_g1_i1.p1 TRINITY_DN19407_c0_g1~~TRINITY_DN19407_c0_g1_i1.p1  ORF type:complete len:716 (+),score=138.97 TRINITY_DN19407_c0_g1_i1:51-2198(+)